jgi:hypothetical protein
MATFLDEVPFTDDDEDTNADVNAIDQQQDDSSEQVDENVNTAEASNEADPDDDIPEKYRGKSAKEIAKMHMEAEKALGRQGSEVGELRRLVDDFIKNQSVNKQVATQQQAPENDVDDDVDFFADPQKAISKAIEKHPKIREAEQITLNMKRAEALATLKAAHPDFQQVITSPDFAEWVTKSKVRQELYIRADQAFDFDAANELLSTWKERQSVVEKTKAVEQVERKQAVKAASTGSAKGSSESTSRKTYRRSDIIDLMVRDPERYAALADEIMLAYQQGRVK